MEFIAGFLTPSPLGRRLRHGGTESAGSRGRQARTDSRLRRRLVCQFLEVKEAGWGVSSAWRGLAVPVLPPPACSEVHASRFRRGPVLRRHGQRHPGHIAGAIGQGSPLRRPLALPTQLVQRDALNSGGPRLRPAEWTATEANWQYSAMPRDGRPVPSLEKGLRWRVR